MNNNRNVITSPDNAQYDPFDLPRKVMVPEAEVPSFFIDPGAYIPGFKHLHESVRAIRKRGIGGPVIRANIPGWIENDDFRQYLSLNFRAANIATRALAAVRHKEPKNKVKVSLR